MVPSLRCRSGKVTSSDQEKRKEIARLRKELQDKENMEKKYKELEEETKMKEIEYREKWSKAVKRRQELL